MDVNRLTSKYPNNGINSANIIKIKRDRKQQIICFNPPLNAKTKTNIGKSFLNFLIGPI